LLLKLIAALVFAFLIAIGLLWARSYGPADVERLEVACSADAPAWSPRSPLKVMSYNVQYMASKNYVFFYDVDVNNPERVDAVAKANKTLASQPSKEHVFWTLDQVAEVISNEDPDIVFLQEMNGTEDSRTYYIDLLNELRARLPNGRYACHTQAPYWKAEFIFHPEILGSVDMQLVTLSKYRITQALRHQLPRPERNFFVRPFHFQRALLESRIATDDGSSLAVINTHFEAWAAGTGLMERQIAATEKLLQSLDSQSIPWVLGGDLNLLPPDDNRQRRKIIAAATGVYDESPQIQALYQRYRAVPNLQHLLSDDAPAWYTYFPNDPTVDGPDRTIDYLFFSEQWKLDDAQVLQQGTLNISDHLPVIGIYSLPGAITEL